MRHFLCLITLIMLFASSCRKYDDSALVGRVDELENRLAKLEQLCHQMNTNISSLQSIVKAIQDKDLIKSLTPVIKDNREIAYTISFVSGKTITIYHGQDGTDGNDGYVPQIGVRQDTDAFYYWTVDGEWMIDEKGNRVKASPENGADGKDGENGEDGQDGQDGITPQLKIEEDYWYVSYDNGVSWTMLGKATGEDGLDGSDGVDGYRPEIGVRQDADSLYYWIVDGEWLTDDKGNKIMAEPGSGSDGQDGITPELKIEDGYWYVSYDEGQSWTKLGAARGNDGDSFFQSVTQDDKNVYFKLADGTTISIAKSKQNIKLTYIPRYSDGKATVFYSSKADSYVELDFEVTPASAAEDWKNISSVKAVYTETRAGLELVDMEILSWTTDSAKGIITVQASGKNLSEAFFDGQQEASVRLAVQGEGLNMISTYIPMLPQQRLNLTDNVLITTWEVNAGEKYYPEGIAGADNPLVAIDYGDGTLGNKMSHIYETSGEYTVKFYFEKPITELSDFCFWYSWIKSVLIPKEVLIIGASAFYGTKLQEVTFESQSSLQEIGNSAFAGTLIKEFKLPSSVESIGRGVFADCKNLKNISASGNPKFNSWDYFDFGTSVLCSKADNKIVAYPSGSLIESLSGLCGNLIIGELAFYACNNLKDVSLVSIVKIEEYNFRYCTKLESIRLNSTEYISTEVLNHCDELLRIDAPDAKEIGESCFCNNKSLTEISLGCDELKTINVIGNDNESLQTVWLPSGVVSIANSFNNCSSITEIYCKASVPPALNDSFGSLTDAAKIYVPSESVDDYEAADNWKDYAGQIEGYDFN